MKNNLGINASYAYKLDAEDGGFIVQFLDFEDAFSEGDTEEEAHFNAREVLDLVVTGRIEDGFDLPRPSEAKGKNVFFTEPSADLQLALLVHWLREDNNVSLADLGRNLKTSWAGAQKLEKPGNNPTLNKLSSVADVLGKRLQLSFV